MASEVVLVGGQKVAAKVGLVGYLVICRWEKFWWAVRYCMAAETISLVMWQVDNAILLNKPVQAERPTEVLIVTGV